MKKYFALFKVALGQSLSYRAETALWIVLDIFPIMITVIMWTAIYSTNAESRTLSLSQLSLYYLAVLTVANLAETHFDEKWVDNVVHGRIDHLLTKPLNFILNMVMIQLSSKVLGFITFLVPTSIITWILVHNNVIHLPPLSAAAMTYFGIFLCLAFVMNCIFSSLIVLTAFWFDESRSLSHLKWMMSGVFGGGIAPLAFYPQWIQNIGRYLPFSRMLSLPATILSQQSVPPSILYDVGMMVVFVAVGIGVVSLVWRGAMRKYSAVGG